LVVDLKRIKEINAPLLQRGVWEKHGEYDEKGKQVRISAGRISDSANEARLDLKKNFPEYWGTNSVDFLFNVFYGKKVVSREDWQVWQANGAKPEEKPEPKDLFYNPQNNQAAFEVDKIREADFYLGVWDFQSRKKPTDDYSPFHKGSNILETALACRIYHPQFGDGRRNKQGQLEVTFYKSMGDDRGYKIDAGERRAINADWLTRFGPMTGAFRQKGGFYLNPREHLEKGELPNLARPDQNGQSLLAPEDFRVLSSSETAKKYGVRLDIRKSGNAATVMIESVRYNLGSEFLNDRQGYERYAVYKISDTLAGIVEIDKNTKEEKLVKTFELVAINSSKAKKREFERSYGRGGQVVYWDVGKRELVMHDFDEGDSFLPQRPGESNENFTQRTEAFNFTVMLQARRDFTKETGINLMRLSPQEQAIFLEYYQSLADKDRLYKFVRIFKEAGLKTLLALQYDRSLADKILAAAEVLSAGRAEAVFEKFSEILAQADRVDEELKNYFITEEGAPEVQRHKILKELIKRAGDFIIKMTEAKDRLNAEKMSDLVKDLEGVKEDMELFVAIFKTTFKGGKVDLEKVRGLGVAHYLAKDIPTELRPQIAQIATENHQTGLTRADALLQNALRMSRGETDDTVYILTKEGKAGPEVLSFTRFKQPDEDGTRYWGSFNVNPKYRGSAFGEAMLTNVTTEMAEQYVLKATVFSKLDVGTDYVDKRGFVIVGVDDDLAEQYGETHFRIIWDNKKNQEFKLKDSRQVSRESLIKAYLGSNPEDVDKSQVLIYRLPVVEDKEIERVVLQRTAEGYAGTRYFTDPQDSAFRYFVFEQDSREVKK